MCNESDFGDYKCSKYVDYIDKSTFTKDIYVDKCLHDEILSLLKQGITTHASCCGHGKIEANIVVSNDSIEQMYNLGYELVNIKGLCEEVKCCTFKAKSKLK
jgi:hypothetical protein